MRALVVVLLVAGCHADPAPVSPGTGGAVCSFTASGMMMANLATTSLTSSPVDDVIVGTVAPTGTNVKWLRSFVVDGGCVGNDQLVLNLPDAPSAGESVPCDAAGQGIVWLEGACTGTRAWVCSGGMLHVDAVTDTTLDLTFDGEGMMPGGFSGTNLAVGTVALQGSCTGIQLHR